MPALLQVVLFAYWALYWPPVRGELGWILTQLAFAYAVDAALGLLLERRWTISVGPMPVVGSTNLFVWFPPSHHWLALVVITLALTSKAFLKRDGRHVFNPSAFGISMVGLACMAFPEALVYTDIAHELDVPPNMTELALLLALVAQLRFPIVAISLFAALAMLAVPAMGISETANPFWSPVFLAVVLLATDPATSPRTQMGRVLFGVAVGLGISLASKLFVATGQSDFFSKVLPMPVLNLLAPAMDEVGGRAQRWLDAVIADALGSEPRPLVQRAIGTGANLFHVLAWVVLVPAVMQVDHVKHWQFEASAVLQRTHEPVPLLRRGPEGELRCDDNPVFCEVFSFPREVALWTGGEEAPR